MSTDPNPCRICDQEGGGRIWSAVAGGSVHEGCWREAIAYLQGTGLHPAEWPKALEALRGAPESMPRENTQAGPPNSVPCPCSVEFS